MERIDVIDSIKKAVFLRDQITIAGSNHGCFPVAIQALGGRFHPQEAIESTNGIVNLRKYLGRRGLVAAWTYETEEQVSASDVENLLKLRFPGKEPQGVFRGHLCGVTPADRSGEGHVVAIIPPHLMSRDTRRRLKKEQRVVVVNPAERGVVGVTLGKLSNYLNNYYGPQRNFFMARINQFK